MDFTFDAKDDPLQIYNGLASSTIDKPLLPTMSQQLPTVGALQSSAPPPFLTKTYDMVDDPATDKIVSWSSTDNSFVVWSPPEFSRDLLPKFFKHNHFSSFVRQLNIYGFRKVDPDRWEFANERFLRGQRQLLRSIHRRKPAQGHSQQQGHGPSLEVSKFGGMEGEIERLKRDKNVLMCELVRIKQQHQTTEQKLRVMGQRLHSTEQRQGQMMSFLAKAMQNPTFLSQLMQKSDNNKRYDSDTKKRRLQNPVNKGLGGVSGIPISEVQLMKHEVASVNEHTHSMLVELLSSSGASKRADRPFVMVDRPVAPEERVSNSEEDEFSSPGGQGEVTRKKMHVPAGAIMRSSQVAAYEREHLYDSQVQASVSAIPDDARGFEDRGLVGGECLPEMWFSCAVERFPQEDVESVVFHNVPGMNDMFCEQFLGGKLDSGDSATDADGEFSGSGSGDQDGDYAVSPQEWRINKRNRDQLGYDFERRSLFSNSMKLPVL